MSGNGRSGEPDPAPAGGRPLLDLRGRNAVVTGGTRGIGRATALLLARAGASVGVGYRSRRADAERTVDELRSLGCEAWAEGADLSTPDGAATLFERADREFDGLDIVVASAGVWPSEEVPVQDLSAERWRATVGANLDSAFHTCREAASRLRRGGSLVLVSSTAGQRGEAGHVDYAASKGALHAMVKGLCVELAPREVTVNAVAPGWVETEMAEPALAERRAEIEASIPRGRVASAEEIAGPIVFLCSPLARHVTGEVMNVNGGAVLPG